MYRPYHFQMYRVYQNEMYRLYHFEMYRLQRNEMYPPPLTSAGMVGADSSEWSQTV